MYGPPLRGRNNGPEKPKSIKGVPRYLKQMIGGFFYRYAYIFKLVWETSPFILFAMAFSALFNGLTPVLGAFITANLINTLVDAYNGLESHILFWIVLQFAYLLFQGIVSTIYDAVIKILSEKVVNHIKVKIITKARDIDIAQYDMPQFYEKLENASREASFRPVQILAATFKMISSLISVISFIIVLIALNPVAPLIIILFSFPAAIIRFVYSRKNFHYMRHRSKDRRQMEYYSAVLTNKDLSKEIRIFNLSDFFIDKFQSTFARYYKGLKSLTIRETAWHVLITIVSAGLNALLFFYIAKKVSSGEGGITVGDFSLYSGSLNSIISAVSAVVSATANIYEGTLFIDNMIAFDNVEAKIVPSIETPRRIEKHKKHTIEFKDVYFSYPGVDKYVLKNINFKIEGGKTAVLVGLNGAGKTTLIKLLTRLYDPSKGVILLDGVDIREYDLKDLYSIYGIIFQDFGKYALTANENIVLGDIDKEMNEADVIDSASKSGANDFIQEFPEKYDTPLSKYFEENGRELSIGQWQKLSVARSFYSDSDILILDEPTASLDAFAEQQIFNELEALEDNKTVVFVSHRLSSATRADMIIVIENGEIIELGNHKELMEKKGKYFKLFTAQAKRYKYDNKFDEELQDNIEIHDEKSDIDI